MFHLRIVAPPEVAPSILELFERTPTVISVVHLPLAARKPHGDLILADVAREDASVVLDDLKALGVEERGSIAVEQVDTAVSERAKQAARAAPGAIADAVLWEEVTEETSESATLSAAFLSFIVLAGLIAAIGIFLDSPILIVGAMVVGPEFGPVAGICVAVVQREPSLAARSARALAVGFPAAIAGVVVLSAALDLIGVGPERFSEQDHSLARIIANPDAYTVIVAFCAGVAGMLSLSTAKSGALIGVLISVTTIPAAANVGISAYYGSWDSAGGSALQLVLNVGSILVAGVLTLAIQRVLYRRRRAKHRHDVAEAVTPSSPATTTRPASSAPGRRRP